MSYRATAQGFGLLTHQLEERYQAGEPLHLTVHGKPKLHILAFKPLAYETYGMLRNRAPYLEGEFALRAFFDCSPSFRYRSGGLRRSTSW
jgi:hypothetical protein